MSQKRAYTEKIEFQFRCKDQSYRFLEFNAINLYHKTGLEGLILDCRDITQRKKDETELVRLQKAKEQFWRTSHMRSVRQSMGSREWPTYSVGSESEDRETYLNAIRHSAENLKVIINDILDLAAIESGKLRFRTHRLQPERSPPLSGQHLHLSGEREKLSLDYRIDEKLNKILLGDPVRLNQILINLISNAVKFTHTGSIQISCTAEKEHRGT